MNTYKIMNESEEKVISGYISSINGSLIKIKGLENQVRLNDLVKESTHKILGEVIQIYSDHVIAKVFENTNNLKLNEEIISLQEPLSMELGPGLLGQIFDGIQRPLEVTFLESDSRGFLERGVDLPSLSRKKKWFFTPLRKVIDRVNMGFVVGTVDERELIEL